MPDLPGVVHGIISLDPPMIQCDGCGKIDTGERLAMAVILSDIKFNPRAEREGVRMCTPCWEDAGWVDTYYSWQPKNSSHC